MRSIFLLMLMSSIGCRAKADKAVQLADQMLEAMGGQPHFDAAHYLRFDFVEVVEGKEISRRSHLWDKYSGRYRLEGKTKDGKAYCTFFNIHTRSGSATLNGQSLPGKDLHEAIEYGYDRYVRDTYWLLMPWKLKDSGVVLNYEGLVTDSISEKEYDVVHLSFTGAGLTAKDQYWAYIDPSTKLMDQCRFILQGDSLNAGQFYWENWQVYEGIKLSDEKVRMDRKQVIKTEKIKILNSLDDKVFTDRSIPLP